ncbi:MAG: Ig-like domain-containing protein, partial [bacterium]
TVTNTGAVPVFVVPLIDTFDTNLLSFASATPSEAGQTGGTLVWSNLGMLNVGGSTTVTTWFNVLTSGIGTNYVITTTSTNEVPHTNVNPRVNIDKTLIFPTGRASIVGETNVFAITVSNTGDYPLDTVPVTDTYDTSLLAFAGAEPPPDDSADDGTLNWANAGPLAPGASTTITGRFSTVRSGAGTNVVVTAPTTTNNVPVPPWTNGAPHTAVAPLFVAKRVSSPAGRPVAIGEQIEFEITVTNTSGMPIFTVPLTDTFNTDLLSFVSATPPESGQTGGVLTWTNVGPLAVDGCTTVMTRFDVLASGVGTNRVITTASAHAVPHTNVNPRVSIVKELIFPQGRPALWYNVTRYETNVFTITVSNIGDYPLETVPVEDTYCWDMLTYVEAEPSPDDDWDEYGNLYLDDGVLNWSNVGPLAPGDSVTITARFEVVDSGMATNMAVSAPRTISEVPVRPVTNDALHTTAAPSVSIVKLLVSRQNDLALQIGEYVVFWIEVANAGDVVLDKVPVIDEYDTASLTYLYAVPPSDNNLDDGVINWANLGPLAPGAITNLFLTFRAKASTAPPAPPAPSSFRQPKAAPAMLDASNTVVTTPETVIGVPIEPMTSTATYNVDAMIGVDNVSAGTFQEDPSGTVMHMVYDSSTNHLLVAGISINNTPEAWGMVTNVLYGNLPLTLAGARTNDDKVVSIWVLTHPPVGTAALTVNFNQAPGEGWVAGVMTLRNVEQVIPCGVFASSVGNSGTQPHVSLASSLGEMIVDTVALQGVNLTAAGAGQTEHWSLNSETNLAFPWGYTSGGGSTRDGAPSVTNSWTATYGSSINWAMGALAIRPHQYAKITSQTAVQASRNPSEVGEAVTFTASVTDSTGSGHTPTGLVKFTIDGMDFGDLVALAGATAISAAVADLTEGSHTVIATYLGDANFNGSWSDELQQRVEIKPTISITAIRIQNGHAVVEWPGTSTWSYTVLTTPELCPLVPWSNLLDYVNMQGTNGPMSVTDTNVLSGAWFYRVKVNL